MTGSRAWRGTVCGYGTCEADGDFFLRRLRLTKVLLVDDHPLLRAGIRQILTATSEFLVVGEAGRARDAFVLIDAEEPDVVLMDVALPGMDGVIATREIRRRAARTRVLILTVHDQITDVLDALNAGATGYALKTDDTESLLDALRTVAKGERYLAPAIAARLESYESRRRKASDVLSVLSVREREVFRLAAECLITREIAHEPAFRGRRWIPTFTGSIASWA